MRHSDLINPADLHFSKFKSFSGSPSAIAPDFADQILAATDTNKIYRATGTTQGAIVELTGGDAGNSSPQQALIIGSAYPYIAPSFIGQQYFRRYVGAGLYLSQLFVAAGLTETDWLLISAHPQIRINISDNTSLGISYFNLYFSKNIPDQTFEFTNLVHQNIDQNNVTLTSALSAWGIGYYAIAPADQNISNVVCRCTTPSTELIYDPTAFFYTEDMTGYNLSANARPIGSEILNFAAFPPTPTKYFSSGDPFELSFEASLI